MILCLTFLNQALFWLPRASVSDRMVNQPLPSTDHYFSSMFAFSVVETLLKCISRNHGYVSRLAVLFAAPITVLNLLPLHTNFFLVICVHLKLCWLPDSLKYDFWTVRPLSTCHESRKCYYINTNIIQKSLHEWEDLKRINRHRTSKNFTLSFRLTAHFNRNW